MLTININVAGRLYWMMAVLAGAVLMSSVAPGPAEAARSVGVATVIVRDVTGTLEKSRRVITSQDGVFQNEVIETNEDSATEIVFLDQTKISIGPNSKVILDKFLFDPDPKKGTFVVNVVSGMFRFASGGLSKNAYEIRTPVSTMGVRGTEFIVIVLEDGSTAIIGEVGEVEIKNCEEILQELTTPGYFVQVEAYEDGTCSAPTEPAPAPPGFLALVDQLDLILTEVTPAGGPPGGGGGGGGPPPPPPPPPGPSTTAAP